jgi:hypothetical protein
LGSNLAHSKLNDNLKLSGPIDYKSQLLLSIRASNEIITENQFKAINDILNPPTQPLEYAAIYCHEPPDLSTITAFPKSREAIQRLDSNYSGLQQGKDSLLSFSESGFIHNAPRNLLLKSVQKHINHRNQLSTSLQEGNSMSPSTACSHDSHSTVVKSKVMEKNPDLPKASSKVDPNDPLDRLLLAVTASSRSRAKGLDSVIKPKRRLQKSTALVE